MLSDATLNRVSNSYRRGYHDGYDNTSQGIASEGPFASFDYNEGLLAGWNDRFWADNKLPTLEARTVRHVRLVQFKIARGIK